MYLHSARIQNLRCLRDLTWSLDEGEEAAGWHVVLGPNGAGKSTFLRAVALPMLEGNVHALPIAAASWLPEGVTQGTVTLDLVEPPNATRSAQHHSIHASIHRFESAGTFVEGPRLHAYPSRRNFFSAGYGPSRRFSGGDRDADEALRAQPILARHVSLFGEPVALTEALTWMKQLQFESLEARSRGDAMGGTSGRTLSALRSFVNQPGLLPHGARLDEVTSKGVRFVDGHGHTVPVEELSDGFRAILSLVFDLVRHMVARFDVEHVFRDEGATVDVAGVVLIDEVDAHLHPSWQREIGFVLTRLFPKVQFLVTTHSPLVCQAAVRGSVFRLAEPGGSEPAARVRGDEYHRLVWGNVLDAYATESFGRTNGAPSKEAREKRARLATLNALEISRGLDEHEREEQTQLRAAMPTAQRARP